MGAATWGLAGAVVVATIVDRVGALTIVMAMGMSSWRSTLLGVTAALAALAALTAGAVLLVAWFVVSTLVVRSLRAPGGGRAVPSGRGNGASAAAGRH